MASAIRPRPLRLRSVEDQDDIKIFEDFLLSNRSEMLPIPTRKDLLHALSDGGLYLVEDCTTGVVLACAGLFAEYLATTRDGQKTIETLLFEGAGMRALPREVGGIRPHSIQEILYWIRTVRLLADQASAVDSDAYQQKFCFISGIIAGNEKSIRGTTAAGFRMVNNQPKWLRAYEDWADGKPVNYYTLPPSAVAEHAAKLQELLKNGGSLYRDDQTSPRQQKEWFTLSIDQEAMRLDPELLALIAAGEFMHLVTDEIPDSVDPYYPHNDSWSP